MGRVWWWEGRGRVWWWEGRGTVRWWEGRVCRCTEGEGARGETHPLEPSLGEQGVSASVNSVVLLEITEHI